MHQSSNAYADDDALSYYYYYWYLIWDYEHYYCYAAGHSDGATDVDGACDLHRVCLG